MKPDPLFLGDLEAFDPHAPRSGTERRFCCPLCGQGKPKDAAHRSLNANTQSGAYVCQRCDARGKLADFWTERPKGSGRDFARQQLRRVCELPPVEAPQPDADKQRRAQAVRAQLEALEPLEGTRGAAYLRGRGAAYLRGRGVSLEVAHAAGAGFSSDWFGRGAVVFPIRNRAGEPVAAQGRYIDGRDDPKTRTLGPKSQGMFAAAGAFDVPALIVTEAPLDALSLAVAGFPAAALCGKSGPHWLPKACFCKTVFLAFDADDAGDEGADKLAPTLESFGATVHRLRPEGAKDWNEFLSRFGRDELADFLAVPLLS